MVFLRRLCEVDIFNGVFLRVCELVNSIVGFLHYQDKRKRALLGSNLPGIVLMTDENIIRGPVVDGGPYYFQRSLCLQKSIYKLHFTLS